jgi:hypothetical protein
MSNVGAYLAKKSWNPGNIKNVEDVWVKEKQQQEQQKLWEDRQKLIEDERAEEELEQLQVEAGVKKGVAGRLKWMYEGGGVSTTEHQQQPKTIIQDEKEREKYLLGEKTMPQFNGQDSSSSSTFGSLEKTSMGVLKIAGGNNSNNSNKDDTVKRIKSTNDHHNSTDDTYLQTNAHDRFILSHEDPMADMIMSTSSSKSTSTKKKKKHSSSKKHKHDKKHHKHSKKHRSSSSSSSPVSNDQ